MKLFFPRMIDYDSISASCSKPGHRGLSDPCYKSSITYCSVSLFIVSALMYYLFLLFSYLHQVWGAVIDARRSDQMIYWSCSSASQGKIKRHSHEGKPHTRSHKEKNNTPHKTQYKFRIDELKNMIEGRLLLAWWRKDDESDGLGVPFMLPNSRSLLCMIWWMNEAFVWSATNLP